MTKDRAPAFYGEKVYKKEDAEIAQNGAKEIVKCIAEIKTKLDKK